MKNFFGLILGCCVCALLGAWREGLLFLGAALFVSLPEFPVCRWYGVAIGGLAAGAAELLAGDGAVLFWALTATALIALSLRSLPKTAILTAAGWVMLKNGVGPEIYVPLYIGVIYNAAAEFAFAEIGMNSD